MLFSDIEGSTALLGRLGNRYGAALSAQRRMMRAAIGSWSGREMGTEGDSFFVVFESARFALSACLQAQRALAAFTWPDGAAVKVRMGVHTGEPTRHEEGYVGMDLNRAARIAATAHGGQVVVSRATGQLVGPRLPEGVGLADLGWHRLKDIAEPEQIFQLTAPDLPVDFPPLKSLGAQTSLPVPATPLLGRVEELQAVQGAVTRPGVRLVTLTGPGGVGKTRLALAAAASLNTTFRDGVYFVPLSTVSDADVMWKVLADAVGTDTEAAPDSAVCQLLAERRVLLVLDNLEQLEQAAGVVATLLAAAPELLVIVTSRRPLHLQAECEYPVPPLAGPHDDTLGGIAASAAVNLFVRQAGLVRRGFTLTANNAEAVAAICRRLDGLPLAIELAASRTKLLSPRALLSRLGDSLDLAATEVDRPSRQQTVRATIAWSHDLLSPDLQRVFRRMGLFAGGCDLDAVAVVAVADTDAGAVLDPLQAVSDLFDLSLVTVTDTPEGDIRVAMLETIHNYARDQLVQSGEQHAAHRRHAEYYVEVAEQANAGLRGSHPLLWLDRLEIEHDNLEVALLWTLGGDPPGPETDPERRPLGLRMVNALSWYWYSHDISAGRRWLDLAVDQATGDDGPLLAEAVEGLGWLLLQQGQPQQAKDALEQNLLLCRRLGHPPTLAKGLDALAMSHLYLDQPEVARPLLEESLEIARGYPDDPLLGTVLNHLAMIAVDTDDTPRAMSLMNEYVILAIRRGDNYGVATGRMNLAVVMKRAGQPAEAHQLLCSLIDDLDQLGDKEMMCNALDEFIMSAAERTADVRAARLSGAVEQLREQNGVARRAADTRDLEQSLAPVRMRLGRELWDTEVTTGRHMTASEAFDLARQSGSGPA